MHQKMSKLVGVCCHISENKVIITGEKICRLPGKEISFYGAYFFDKKFGYISFENELVVCNS